MSNEEIEKICEQYSIVNYTINNGIVDVYNEDFICGSNNFTSLEGAPHTVGGDFRCSMNKLTDLKHCPKKVGGVFDCSWNDIINVDYHPEYIGQDLYIGDNPIHSIIFISSSIEFLDAIRIYKVIKGTEINLKRLKYVMETFNYPIYLDNIEKYYTIK